MVRGTRCCCSDNIGNVANAKFLFQKERTGDVQPVRSEEHTSELQSRFDLVCRLLLEKKKNVGKEQQNRIKKKRRRNTRRRRRQEQVEGRRSTTCGRWRKLRVVE